MYVSLPCSSSLLWCSPVLSISSFDVQGWRRIGSNLRPRRGDEATVNDALIRATEFAEPPQVAHTLARTARASGRAPGQHRRESGRRVGRCSGHGGVVKGCGAIRRTTTCSALARIPTVPCPVLGGEGYVEALRLDGAVAGED